MENAGDFWLAGDTLLRGYYTIHDEKASKIGFAAHSTSNKASPAYEAYLPEDTLPTVWNVSPLQEVLAVIVGLALTFFFLYRVLPRCVDWWSHHKEN